MSLIAIVFMVGVAYIILMAAQPAISAMVETANSSINATAHPEAQAVLVGWPFWAYFVPAAIGMVAVVIVLARGK